MLKDTSHSRNGAERTSTEDDDQNLRIAIIAHELRDPLVPLKNLAHVLRGQKLDVEWSVTASGIIDRQVLAMARLIDDLLDSSHLASGNLHLKREQATASEIVARAVDTVRPLVQARAHKLTVSVPPESIVLYADVSRMCQVLHNLIGNAAKYTQCGGQIRVDVRRESDEVVVTVSDNGTGIAPVNLQAIFEPFEQGGLAATPRSTGGVGIGLYLARNLVEAHGGTLLAMSAGAEGGSKFVIRLPCTPGAPTYRPDVHAPAASP
jgi:signal transduction histidine kinase